MENMSIIQQILKTIIDINMIKIKNERIKISSILRYVPYDIIPLDDSNTYGIEFHVTYFDKKDIIKVSFGSDINERNRELHKLDLLLLKS